MSYIMSYILCHMYYVSNILYFCQDVHTFDVMSGITFEHLHSDLAADGVTYDGDLCASWYESL